MFRPSSYRLCSSAVGLAVFVVTLFSGQRVSADPQLVVTANHLGGGVVQYTLQIDNDAGGNVNIQISAQGNINQVQSSFFADAFPNGGVSLQSQADTAGFDPDYTSAGGKAADSWWDDIEYGLASPPFGGDLGGAQGSTLFQYSAGTFGLRIGVPNVTLLGQIVIVDPAAAGLPTGQLPVREAGLAIMSIIDPGDSLEDSVVSAAGDSFSLVRDYGIVPEPSAFVLAALGLLGVAAFGRGRHRRI